MDRYRNWFCQDGFACRSQALGRRKLKVCLCIPHQLQFSVNFNHIMQGSTDTIEVLTILSHVYFSNITICSLPEHSYICMLKTLQYNIFSPRRYSLSPETIRKAFETAKVSRKEYGSQPIHSLPLPPNWLGVIVKLHDI